MGRAAESSVLSRLEQRAAGQTWSSSFTGCSEWKNQECGRGNQSPQPNSSESEDCGQRRGIVESFKRNENPGSYLPPKPHRVDRGKMALGIRCLQTGRIYLAARQRKVALFFFKRDFLYAATS